VRFADNSEVHKVVYDAIANAFKGRESAEDTASEPSGFTPFTEGVREPRDTYISSSEGKRDYYPTRDYSQSIPKQQNFTLPRIQSERREWKPDETRHHEPSGQSAPLQVADTYIVVPSEDGMVIDQHAAHERISNEKVARHGKLGHGRRALSPYSLTHGKRGRADGGILELNDIGIEAEHFGGGSFLIRSKPLFMDKVDIKEASRSSLTSRRPTSRAGLRTCARRYQLIACKSAVKAGQRLHPRRYCGSYSSFECESPYTCAHGRPTVIKFGIVSWRKFSKENEPFNHRPFDGRRKDRNSLSLAKEINAITPPTRCRCTGDGHRHGKAIAEDALVLHHLIRRRPARGVQRGDYLRLAEEAIADIRNRGKVPLVAAGRTLRAPLTNGFISPSADWAPEAS
jgi:DNA mismatch repair ATPase MutL